MAHTLLGMGNPLLDISVECEMDLLDKYGLKLNNAILASPSHLPLYQELLDRFPSTVQFIAGGATQNSIRVAQWMAGEKGFSAYAGCIGKDDEFGKQLQAAAEGDGVTCYYDKQEDDASPLPTGTCAVLVHEKERSLVANLSAAERYSKARHFDTAAFQSVVKGAKLIYSAGFFLTHASETMLACGKTCAESTTGQRYAINLSAPFLCQFFKSQMLSVLPYADLVFGNESEAEAFAENNDMPKGLSIAEIAKRIADMPKANASKPRVVVITQGSESTVIAESGKEETTVVPVDKMESHLIVDTNGAGDAFVGGFLAYLLKGSSLVEAAKAGHWAAGHIIQRSGCTFDREHKYEPKA